MGDDKIAYYKIYTASQHCRKRDSQRRPHRYALLLHRLTTLPGYAVGRCAVHFPSCEKFHWHRTRAAAGHWCFDAFFGHDDDGPPGKSRTVCEASVIAVARGPLWTFWSTSSHRLYGEVREIETPDTAAEDVLSAHLNNSGSGRWRRRAKGK